MFADEDRQGHRKGIDDAFLHPDGWGVFCKERNIRSRGRGFLLLSVGRKSVLFFPRARLLCLRFFGSLGQYLAPILSSLWSSQSSSVHERQLMAECLRCISLGMGRVTVSPQVLPMEIRLSVLVTLLELLDAARHTQLIGHAYRICT